MLSFAKYKDLALEYLHKSCKMFRTMLKENYRPFIFVLVPRGLEIVDINTLSINNESTLLNNYLNKQYLDVRIHSLDDLETMLFFKFYSKDKNIQSLTMPAQIFQTNKVEARTVNVVKLLEIKELNITNIKVNPIDLENLPPMHTLSISFCNEPPSQKF